MEPKASIEGAAPVLFQRLAIFAWGGGGGPLRAARRTHRAARAGTPAQGRAAERTVRTEGKDIEEHR